MGRHVWFLRFCLHSILTSIIVDGAAAESLLAELHEEQDEVAEEAEDDDGSRGDTTDLAQHRRFGKCEHRNVH